MDAVKMFNAELSSLYEVKPPISKAKMTALTRGAIKAIKFYKHVVQSVEKFILKCKPEYKVPGLYVIDSIVRQSRHQFGADKDVFAPRFAKNMQQTFINLFKCLPEDKSKIIRVLNLWQKNQVFAPDVVQPLFDLADPNHPIHKEISAAMQNNGMQGQGGGLVKGSPALQKTPTKTPASTDPASLAQAGGISNNPNTTLDANTLAKLQHLHRLLLRQNDNTTKPDGGSQQVHFDRKLLDFDYGSDEDEDPTNPSPKVASNSGIEVGSLLSNPEVLRHLQTLQQTIVSNQQLHPDFDLEKLRKLQEMKQQEDEFDKHLAQTVPNLPFAAECEFKPSQTNSPAMLTNFFLPPGADLSQPPPGYKSNFDLSQLEDMALDPEVEYVGGNDNDIEVIDIDHDDSRSPSRDRYSRRRRSRSKERDRDRNRDRRSRRSRSRSRSRNRRHNRSRSRERDRKRDKEDEKDREKEKERKKRGLPPIKKDNLSVCSTTLWVGHLSKLVHQEDLSDTFGEFGEIVSIDLIIPRGCAFIVMNRRQDAARCLTKLKSHKMQGKAITLAWAPGKGVKGKELKDYWEGDLGVSYIPYMKLKPDIDIELLEDGGMLDEDTIPAWMKDKISQETTKVVETSEVVNAASYVQLPDGTPTVDTSQPPPVPNSGLLQPPPMTMPLVSPFQLNNRLLGMPPGMLPNVPMGVPPPNLQSALLPNQLLGLGNPFGQGLLHPPLAQMSQLDKKSDVLQSSVLTDPTTMLPYGLMPPQPPPLALSSSSNNTTHDDMDVEMEEADVNISKDSKSNDLSSLNGGNDNLRNSREDDIRDNRNRSRDRDRNNSRGRRNSRDRRDRDNSRSDNRVDNRSDNRGDRRERSNRWGDRTRENNRDNSNRDERREREKALNDRLREMAGDNSFREEKEHPPPLLERPPMFNIPFDDNEPDKPPLDRFGGRRRHDNFKNEFEVPEQHTFEEPPMEFNGPIRNFEGPPIDFEGPPIEFEPPPIDFDGPPMDFQGPPIDFEGPPMDFDVPPRDFDMPPRAMMHPRDRFDDRRRGPPDFFPPRDSFGPRGPRFRGPCADGFQPRGPGPDGFLPRGPPMMRPPHMFHPRGPPHMRGPRPGPPWMEGGMRPNFPPRFEGPDFFRGGPPGPPMGDHPRHRRFEDRRRFRSDFDSEQEPPMQQSLEPFDKPEKRSRWGNEEESEMKPDIKEETTPGDETEPQKIQIENASVDHVKPEMGNTTPLHDEREEKGNETVVSESVDEIKEDS